MVEVRDEDSGEAIEQELSADEAALSAAYVAMMKQFREVVASAYQWT